jgi:hypothetical protein
MRRPGNTDDVGALMAAGVHGYTLLALRDATLKDAATSPVCAREGDRESPLQAETSGN